MVILTAEGQIIQGSRGTSRNMVCRVDVEVGRLTFRDVRLEISFEDRNLEQLGTVKFEKLNGKIIEMLIK